MSQTDIPVAGRNGVVIVKSPAKSDRGASGYRSYEVHQRERVGESTPKIKPGMLIADNYRRDPYPVLTLLRENYPCYRNWQTNSYWLTQYNDVTSVFTDDANFESRPKRWLYNNMSMGRDLGDAPNVVTADAQQIDKFAESVAEQLSQSMQAKSGADLALEYAARYPLLLLSKAMALSKEQEEKFFASYWRAQRGVSWLPALQQDGQRALGELRNLLEPLLESRRDNPGDDLLSAMLKVEIDGQPVTVDDVVVTLLERDHETLHGSMANLWFLLLTHPQEFDKARSEQRLMKLAYLETLRHSTPVLSAYRYARHEVERFGKLLPTGALVVCSAAAANRDAKIFDDPERFIVDRKDLCQREPRGQYRADGLATGIAVGLGKPSIHPAIPEDRPRSRYAINRDTVVKASSVLLDMLPDLALAPGAEPCLSALTVGEMHTCWKLPVVY